MHFITESNFSLEKKSRKVTEAGHIIHLEQISTSQCKFPSARFS